MRFQDLTAQEQRQIRGGSSKPAQIRLRNKPPAGAEPVEGVTMLRCHDCGTTAAATQTTSAAQEDHSRRTGHRRWDMILYPPPDTLEG